MAIWGAAGGQFVPGYLHAAPRVSIDMPVYNGSDYLKSAIGSLLTQNSGYYAILLACAARRRKQLLIQLSLPVYTGNTPRPLRQRAPKHFRKGLLISLRGVLGQ